MPTSFLQLLADTHPWGVLVLIGTGFVFVLALFSWLSGWRRLARQFRADGPPPNDMRHFVWGMVGWMEYRHCLAVGGDERGLYLVPNLFFRLFHPPLRIPWSELHDREHTSFFFVKNDTFRAGEGSIRIRLRASLTESLDLYLPPAN